ncbi:unnamed protein product [Rotaria sp. Silwood1]|nr:unnamed protein product [Rotaria sp. Silwood1]
MDKLYGTVCYSIRLLTLYSGVLIVSTFFIIGIILKSIAAPDYVNERRTREFYTNTSCLLLNYTFVIRECQSCAQYSCSTYSCLDEQFFMSYIIFNGTLVNSTFVIYGKATSHKQIQIGIHYPCFYKQANVTSVVWNVPDGKSFVIQLNIFFGIVGLGLVLIIFGVCCWISRKICEDCACISKLTEVIKGIYARRQTEQIVLRPVTENFDERILV